MPATLTHPATKRVNLDDPLYTIRETMEILNFGRSTVYDLVNRHVLKAVELEGIGSRRILRIRRSAIEAYINGGTGQ